MEDIGNIVWIIVLGASVLYSLAAKGKKNARDNRKHVEEAWPTDDTPQRTIERRPARPAVAPAAVLPEQPAPELTKEIEAYEQLERERRADRHRPQPTVPKPELHEVSDALEAEQQDDLIADFNLRKAIVYSEILKPKFEE